MNCACDCGGQKDVLTASLLRGSTGSCGCDKSRYVKTTGDRNVGFKGHREIRSHFWRGYKQGALDRGLPFEISMEYAWALFEAQRRCCALTGEPIVFGVSRLNSLTTASIDRIDNLLGYVEGNVQWVHKRVNVMRHMNSVPDFINWCRKVVAHADHVQKR